MDLHWTKAARRHRIGRAHALYVIQNNPAAPTTTPQGSTGYLVVGKDTTGRELEIVLAEVPDGLLVIHVMPTALRNST